MLKKETIPHEWVEWGADEHPSLSESDFEWTFEPEYPIINIGGQRFIEVMHGWLDDEIDGMLCGYGYPSDVSIEQVGSDGEGRLAGWMELDRDLSEGKIIEEPVCIALINADDSSVERSSICDGWHRVAAAIKHGHKTIPAYVGTLKICS